MPSNYDPTEFVDSDFESHKSPSPFTGTAKNPASELRAPTREEVDSRVMEAQQKLTELRRAQEELERERSALEETRRRQIEFQNGREELIQNLGRAVGLLEEAEFGARREAEQMAKALIDLRDGLTKVQAVREETWTKDNFSMELTRALTALENARMEYNSARLKFPVLSGKQSAEAVQQSGGTPSAETTLSSYSFCELCRMGLALTWPLAAIGFLALGVLFFFLLRR
jgi:DNA repair exonuclease SbcCD ATPase subunit